MAQRTKKTTRRTAQTSPRRVAKRKPSPSTRTRVSGRKRSKSSFDSYAERHGVKLALPDPENWRFKEEVNNDRELRFYVERLPRKAVPTRLVFRSVYDPRTSLRSFAMGLLGDYYFEQNTGIEGRFRGMPALMIDHTTDSRRLGSKRNLPAHQRIIFFRNGRRLCYFDLRRPVDSLDDPLNEVLDAVEVD
jgi:hypothetical protein